jgi:predicted ArsR family transcriptional regulator
LTADLSLSVGRRRILDHLKLSGPATPAELAKALSLTPAAIRQHLDGLAAEGLVTSLGASRAPVPGSGPGRPATSWRLTRRAHRLFPDRHGELTAQLIDAIRTVAGAGVLDAVIEARTAAQRADYEAAIAAGGQSLRQRAESLARRRTAEGYMAEVVPVVAAGTDGDGGDGDGDGDGGVLLIEHHCPICEAAEACLGFCRAELEVFRDVLGEDVILEREEHLLSGGERCAYRLRPAGAGSGIGVPVEVGAPRS